MQIRRPWADYSTKSDKFREEFFTRVQFIYSMDRARNHYSVAEAGIEIVLWIYTLVQKEDKHFLYSGREVYNLSRQQCQRSSSNYKHEEIEEGESSNSLTTWLKCKVLMQSTEFTCPQRRNEFWHTASTPSLCTSLYAGSMRCKSCQRWWKRELFAKDNPKPLKDQK